ncbi:MAG: hypothetical protein K0T00_465 [Gaiellaceae bacterium]|jgi:hypothetical protein|nr:hypothetical protein [Gaiellaceae bacterium]
MRALLALALAALTVTAAGAAATVKVPALRVLDADPLVVRGSGFKPGERVLVRATGRTEPLAKRVRASRTGVFTVRFDALYDYCLGVNLVRATGTRSGDVRIRPSKRFCVYLGD